MQITSPNYKTNFKGATGTLRNSYFKSANEIAGIFTKYPKSKGIAGSLPFSWLKNIINYSKEEKGNIITQVYDIFHEMFKKRYPQNMSKKELSEMSKKFTAQMRALNILPEENQLIIKKRKVDGGIISGAFVISERGENKTLEPLFIKQFKDNFGKHSADKEGIFTELALGLHLGKIFGGNEHIISPYFGDTIGRFMVSKYETAPQKIKIPNNLTISELYSPGILQKYFQKLKAITKDNTDINLLLAKKGFEHNDLHDQNVIITRNKKGKLIVKLIDLGKIVKNK